MSTPIEILEAAMQDLRNSESKLARIVGLAKEDWWVTVDPGYTYLKILANDVADEVIVKANDQKAAIPT